MSDDWKADWLAARCKGLGGSEVAAVLGLSPWRRPIDVFVAKTIGEVPVPPSDALWFGSYMEAGVRRRYAELAGVEVVFGADIATLFPAASVHGAAGELQTIVHVPDEQWRLGSPDGIVRAYRRGWECKTAGYRSAEWGKQGTDEVPGHYLIQCAWYMSVCDLPEWDLAALFRGNSLETFRIRRNPDLEKAIVEAARAFWNDHVLKGIEPEVDESESYAKYLARKFSFSSGVLLEPTPELEEMGADLIAASEAEKQAAAAKQLVKNKLAAALGEANGVKLSSGKVQWIRPKPGDKTDWEALAKSLQPTPEQIAAFTAKQERSAYIQQYPKGEK